MRSLGVVNILVFMLSLTVPVSAAAFSIGFNKAPETSFTQIKSKRPMKYRIMRKRQTGNHPQTSSSGAPSQDGGRGSGMSIPDRVESRTGGM